MSHSFRNTIGALAFLAAGQAASQPPEPPVPPSSVSEITISQVMDIFRLQPFAKLGEVQLVVKRVNEALRKASDISPEEKNKLEQKFAVVLYDSAFNKLSRSVRSDLRSGLSFVEQNTSVGSPFGLEEGFNQLLVMEEKINTLSLLLSQFVDESGNVKKFDLTPELLRRHFLEAVCRTFVSDFYPVKCSGDIVDRILAGNFTSRKFEPPVKPINPIKAVKPKKPVLSERLHPEKVRIIEPRLTSKKPVTFQEFFAKLEAVKAAFAVFDQRAEKGLAPYREYLKRLDPGALLDFVD